MNARYVYLLILVLDLGYQFWISLLQEKQRKLPLPTEVSDIYSEKRYQTYLNFVSDSKKLALIKLVITTLIDVGIIFSPFYLWVSELLPNVYTNALVIISLTYVLECIVDYGFEYLSTFCIEEKYGKNKQTVASFNKDFFLNAIPSFGIVIVLLMGLIFVFEHLRVWTNNFNLNLTLVLTIVIKLVAIGFMIYVIVGNISLLILKKQYTFTPLSDGDLRTSILGLLKDSKKKVRAINVYDESKKSTSKNAFLLKFLWIREFGIADNFINENSYDELLAVLAHEVGHLNHQKNGWNYAMIGLRIVPFIAIIYLLYHVDIVFAFNAWVFDSFNIINFSYPILFIMVAVLIKPITFMLNFLSIYVTRNEEYEADQNAVKEGYGEALISTFKRLSSDELVNVNPHPIVEFLEYDHPGMYQRIKAIRSSMEQK